MSGTLDHFAMSEQIKKLEEENRNLKKQGKEHFIKTVKEKIKNIARFLIVAGLILGGAAVVIYGIGSYFINAIEHTKNITKIEHNNFIIRAEKICLSRCRLYKRDYQRYSHYDKTANRCICYAGTDTWALRRYEFGKVKR